MVVLNVMRRLIPCLILMLLLLSLPALAQEDLSAKVANLYEQAEVAFEHGELTKAISLYQETIKLAPELFEPKFQCANAYLATKQPEQIKEAIKLLQEVVQLKPDFAKGHATLGNALAQINDNEPAEAELRTALQLDATLPLHSLLVELLMERRAYAEAVTELKILINQGKADGRSYLLLGIAQQEQGQLEAAVASYSRANELQPKDPDILYQRGKLYLTQKEYNKATSDLLNAYQGSKNSLAIGLLLIESYASSGDKTAALKLTQELLPQADGETRTRLTELLAQLGANDAAIAQLEKQLKAEPKNEAYLARLTELYLNISPAKAVEYGQQAVTIKPSLTNLVNYGAALLKAQQFAEASEQYQRALAQDGNSYEAHAGLALSQFKLMQFGPAAQQFNRAIQLHPDNSINYYFLGICLDRLNDYRQALSYYEQFLKRADAKINQIEIDRIKLRLPSLRRQAEKQPKKS